MVEDGMMERLGILEVYGMPNRPRVPAGRFAIRAGAFFAAIDQYVIDLEGKGGHAAKPQDCIDTTVVLAHLVLALQTIALRNADPLQALVVSVTSFRTESDAVSVIPQHVRLKGTGHRHDAGLRTLAEARVRRIAEHTSAAFGAVARVGDIQGCPVT